MRIMDWSSDVCSSDLLHRVEVLRGPQGTLFGADSMGGTIRVLTRQPQLEGLDAWAGAELSSVRGGGLGREVQAALGGAIVPGRIGARISAYHRRDAGVVARFDPARSEERRVGKEGGSKWKLR